MAYRVFADESGVEWTVFDVVPRADERRIGERRQSDDAVSQPAADRRTDERRTTVRTSRPVRLSHPWLCFESRGERRRLQPVPDGWYLLSDPELSALMREARVAPRRQSSEKAQTPA